jgi:hypothetical protein
MNIHLSLLGPLKNPFNKSELQFELDSDTTVEALFISHFKYSPNDISQLMFLVGREAVPPGYCLQDGECLTVFLPVGGG